MSASLPPRDVPTLTEVVEPESLASAEHAADELITLEEIAPAGDVLSLDDVLPDINAKHLRDAVDSVPDLDRQAFSDDVLRLVRPELEAELRSGLRALLEERLDSIWPEVLVQIERSVQQAVDRVLTERQTAAEKPAVYSG